MIKAHDQLNLTKQASSLDDDEESGAAKKQNFDIERQAYPSLSNFAETLHDQLWKSFQTVSP